MVRPVLYEDNPIVCLGSTGRLFTALDGGMVPVETMIKLIADCEGAHNIQAMRVVWWESVHTWNMSNQAALLSFPFIG